MFLNTHRNQGNNLTTEGWILKPVTKFPCVYSIEILGDKCMCAIYPVGRGDFEKDGKEIQVILLSKSNPDLLQHIYE